MLKKKRVAWPIPILKALMDRLRQSSSQGDQEEETNCKEEAIGQATFQAQTQEQEGKGRNSVLRKKQQ
jgi:hypothetical protein